MLHERDPELAVVTTALRDARAGRPSLVLVTGPLGIGRSALLQGLPAHVADEGARVLRANAAPMEQDFGFGVVRQLLDSLLAGAPRELCERWTHESAGFARMTALADEAGPGPEGPAAAHEQPALGGLRSLLEDVCADGPLLILVDDLQWVDTPSLRCLAYLVKRLRGLPAVLVCALRDGEPRGRHPLVGEIADAATHRLPLGPLSAAATAETIRDHLGEPGHEDFVRACHDACAGNPLALTSVLQDLAAAGHRPTADRAEAARSARPADLRERLARCVRLQPPAVRDLAAALAVLGDHGDPALAARLAGLDPIGSGAALRALGELGLVADRLPEDRTAGPRPRFAHPAVRDAVHASMTVTERERLHDRAAELLYRTGHSDEQVAAQLMAGVTSRHPWSVGVLRAAADTALRRGAPEAAIRCLRRALLDGSLAGEARARLLIDLAAAERGLDPAACERHISQAIPLLPTPGQRAAAALRLSPAVLDSTSHSAVDLLRQAAAELGPPDALEGAAREVALRLEARLRQCGVADPAELASAVERLHAMGEEPPTATAAERELAAVLLNAAVLSCRLPAADVTGLARRILEREPVASARVYSALPLTTVALVAADSVDAIGSWLSVEQRLGGRDATVADAFGHLEQAMVLMGRGRPAPAHAHAERALRLADAHWRELGVASTIALVFTALEMGDPARSVRILEGASRRRSSCLALTVGLQFLGAAVDAQQGRWAAAVETLMAGGRRLEAAGWRNPVLFPWRPRAAGLHHRLGDLRSALALAEEERLRAEAWGVPVAVGRALRLHGTLVEGEAGEALLREAVGVLRGSANELELARALLTLGRRLQGGAEADGLLREAAALATACEAPWLAERARRGGGGAARPKDTLTRTERRVVALAGRGLTNTEIAGELGVTSRAIEKHLTNSYRKLAVSGRRELIAALPRLQAVKGG
ncbi:AAA family ATPase [Streptomyces sparsogenes]|uniref:AAA family ATPase n=1 Tax=Streptomyces sparsogenes TaxID=67365 RepID=UPI00384ADC9C